MINKAQDDYSNATLEIVKNFVDSNQRKRIKLLSKIESEVENLFCIGNKLFENFDRDGDDWSAGWLLQVLKKHKPEFFDGNELPKFLISSSKEYRFSESLDLMVETSTPSLGGVNPETFCLLVLNIRLSILKVSATYSLKRPNFSTKVGSSSEIEKSLKIGTKLATYILNFSSLGNMDTNCSTSSFITNLATGLRIFMISEILCRLAILFLKCSRSEMS